MTISNPDTNAQLTRLTKGHLYLLIKILIFSIIIITEVIMKLKLSLIFSILALNSSCTKEKLAISPLPHSTAGREIASTQSVVLKYISYVNSESVANAISPVRWEGTQGGFSKGGRQDFLLKLYYANTRELSNSGQKHAACFDGGTAKEVQEKYFQNTNPNHFVNGLLNNVAITKASSDGLMLGIRFAMTLPGQNEAKDFYFRLPHCLAGKTSISDSGKIVLGNKSLDFSKFKIDQYAESENKGQFVIEGRAPSSTDGILAGFMINDQPVVPAGVILPRFSLRADYENAQAGEVLPWKNADVTTEAGALKLAYILQKYIYENMANQDLKNPDMNFDATKNSKRYFCHTPWLNVGPSGREGIHGLTKERDLKPSTTMDVYSAATPGSDWGVAYYNSPACKTINAVYGSKSKPLASTNYNAAIFENGSFAAKLLFTTADFHEIKGAYKWNANVSDGGSNFRSIKPIRHIQMDITVRDTSIKGSNPALNHWIMYTYYYDPGFDFDREYKTVVGENPLKSIPGIPASLLKMRPMGVQLGFGKPSTKESVIFAGAQTNGVEGRLNGPADNNKSSCLGCHGTAGTGLSMVPGLLTNSDFNKKTLGYLDFSQQFAYGRRNLETVIPPVPTK